MSAPSVAVVILNYNGKQHLERFLPSVLATNYPNMHLVVADNASTDDSVAFLQAKYPHLDLRRYQTNEGFAGGYNRVLKELDTDYYVLLNSDVEVDKDWLAPMIDLLEADQQLAACQPKLLAYHDKAAFEYAGAAGGWLDPLGYPFSRGRVFDVCEIDQGQYQSNEPIFWASGAALCIRAGAYHQVGGLDESFFAHQEEIDLCWRLQLAGYQLKACPAAVVYHVGGGTLPRGGRKVFLNFRNNLVMLMKNLSFGEMLWKIPMRLGLDAISAWKGLFHGDVYFFVAIFRAHLAFMSRVFTGKIRYTHGTKPMNQLAGVARVSVVWQHFVKGKRYFHEIVQKPLR